jgi:nitroimidazol reductase NimA-like FMN-containing flavoprotein (pyridoxamine 5'-phosphate oxidase superfamily)
MQDVKRLVARIERILRSQRLAVLSTYGGGQPYASLVAFTAPDDLKRVVFATTRSTRKFSNIASQENVALLIDTRGKGSGDFMSAVAITAIGTAHEVPAEQREHFVTAHLAKHPALESFVASPTCALLVVEVQKYYLVSRFQNVQELHPR